MEEYVVGQVYVAYSTTQLIPVKRKEEKLPGRFWRIFPAQVAELSRLQTLARRHNGGNKPDIELLLNAMIEVTLVSDEMLKQMIEVMPEVRARFEAECAKAKAVA